MRSNFEFLKADPLTTNYFLSAFQAEQSYAMGLYSGEMTLVRVIAETVARDIADQKYLGLQERSKFNDVLTTLKYQTDIDSDTLELFYQAKQQGNKAAHELAVETKIREDQQAGLIDLKRLYKLMAWFANTFYEQNVEPTAFYEPTKEDFLYSTVVKPSASERNLIYIQSAKTGNGHFQDFIGSEKIGKARAGDLSMDNRPNSPYLREVATKRIKQYMTTAGVPMDLQWVELAYRPSDGKWFTDKDVHRVLERSGIKRSKELAGEEWFKTDLETAKRAIKAVKDNRTAIDPNTSANTDKLNIVLRPEQQEAVDKTKKAFNKKYDKMLWNAKMRFGKTLSALQLVKDEGYQHVLIMTHRPVVDEGWFDDFNKIQMPAAGYEYGSKTVGHRFADLEKSNKPYVYFASLQDLRGSEAVGGSAGDKNEDIFHTKWDLVIVDEAHEGTQTDLAQNVTKEVVTKGHTKLLELSGTPFNLLDQYEDDQVFTWDYVMEQKAKYNWSKEHPNERNPYAGLPKVNMFTFEMNKQFADFQFMGDGKKSFNFKEFFKVNSDGEFVYKDKVRQFLDNISSPDSRTNYPYSTKEFRDKLRHTLWILPGVKEANALEKMLKHHPVFGMEYKIVNVVRNGDNEGVASQSDVDTVNQAIGKDPAVTKTITLTVRKLTTGVTIKPWTGVVFLSNTNSAMQYLQAAFRAQTPYSSPTFGTKTNCYIFDFAPDRALTVMAASTQLNTGVGKRTSSAQKAQMSELMNFLPILGERGQGMKPYKVDTMLAQIKRVYAEKAVRTGFDDDSLYSDELLMLKDVDLKAFNQLKAIVGTTKSEKKPMKVDINHQGLSDEEYDDALKGQKRKPKERTPEQQAAMDKMKKLKKQRKTMISILRSISIRIPMMIYGMDVKLSDDVNIKTFVNKVDNQSWKEFMPKGVTKELFMEFSKYYDQDVFIEAGRIIRHKVKELDKLDPVERTEQLAAIFGTFHNPDKETVLTPWRVVNMHLSKTIGGLSFYDDQYLYTTKEGVRANHWVNTEYTDKIINSNAHILEINSKTGLYPLYVGMSLYWRQFQKLNEETAGKFSFENQLMIWQQILRENLFLVAKTPMAKAIAKRTLAGYRDFDVNVEFVNNIVKDSKEDVVAEANKIERLFGNMKFDVVIGNPPYQQDAKGDSNRKEPLYHEFMDLSYKLAPLVTLITPGRFLFNVGQTPKKWNEKMLNDEHLKVVLYQQDATKIFPRTETKGGIAITLRDAHKKIGPIGTFTAYDQLNSIIKKVKPSESLSRIISSQGLYRFSDLALTSHPGILEKTGKGTKNKITSRVVGILNSIFTIKPTDNSIKMVGYIDSKRQYRYVNKKYVEKNDYINAYKVIIAESNGSGILGEALSNPFVGNPGVGNTDTYLNIGPFNNKNEANNLLKYIKTKFARVMLGIKKITQHNPRSAWVMVPIQDFSSHSDIDWSQSIPQIDRQLYRKYNLSEAEISFIETKAQEME